MISLDLSTSAKLVLLWIILKCYYVLHLILDSILDLILDSIILVFCCKFCPFRIILSYIAYFYFFCLRIYKPNIHNNIIGISCFQNGLNDHFSSTDFCFKSKMIESSHMKKCFIIVGRFFSKCTFLRLYHLFLSSGYPINLAF